ncbi:hypothetical protein [Nonomuraea sp. NPDC005650]
MTGWDPDLARENHLRITHGPQTGCLGAALDGISRALGELRPR